MRFPVLRVVALACIGLLIPAAATRAAVVKEFAHPDRIRYDSQCLTIDGQDTFIFSGAFHYFRTPKALWRERFEKIKEAHCNAVETYVPWNWCEQEMPAGLDDHSKIDLSDFKEWMKMAHEEFGLYTIIRPGPYICAEWVGGGFPQWLWSKRPAATEGKAWLRSDDPTYLAWVKHWYDQVIPVIAAEQVTHKPKGSKGVILVQIENEYDFFGGPSDAAKIGQLQFLYKNAVANGIDVPIFTCWTRQVRGSTDPILSQVFDTCNFYHAWNMMATANGTRDLLAKQTNAPGMVTELQGGWFAEAGGKLSQDQGGIEAEQTNSITLTAIANGATLTNYYMLVGGSNFGAWNGGDVLQTYDYFAPIREDGSVGKKYELVKAIGTFLADHGAELTRAKLADAKITPADKKLVVFVRQTANGDHFIFCRNTENAVQKAQFDATLTDGTQITVERELPPRLMEVLYLPSGKTSSADGTWYGQPAAELQRPAVAAPVRIATAETRNDPGPAQWQPIANGTSLIQAGIYDVQDVVYRTRPTLTVEQAAKFTSLRVGSDEIWHMALLANGQPAAAHSVGNSVTFAVKGLLHEGANDLQLVYQNHGIAHFGEALNKQTGVRSMSLLPPNAEGTPLTDWRVSLLKDGQKPDVAPEFDDSKWDRAVLDEKTFAELAVMNQPGHPPLTYPAAAILRNKNGAAVYRTMIDLSSKDLAAKPIMIDLQRIDDEGDIYVNGTQVGTSRNWRTPFVADITKFVHEGKNCIAVVVRNFGYDGGILMPAHIYSEEQVLTLPMEIGTPFTGVAEQWWQGGDGKDWQPISLDTTTPLTITRGKRVEGAPATTLGKWFHTEFELPIPAAGVWAPWNAVIDAYGSGYVYLNGHNLGRYYDSGPQRQYFLPGCWLKTGPGEKNVLTLFLHPAGMEPSLKALELRQYQSEAEKH